MKNPDKARLAVVGIGNILVGDDGAGIAVLNRLRESWGEDSRVRFLALEGDLYEIGDYLDRAEEFIFVDAVAGENVGAIVESRHTPRAYAPSFHQTDIGSVMECLRALHMADPFPAWTLWGIVIAPPTEVTPGLTPAVAEAVEELAARLRTRIPDILRTPPAAAN